MGMVERKNNMDKIQLNGEKREVKSNLNKLRKSGKIPAVLYGHKVLSTPLTIDLGVFEKVLRKAGESTIIDLVTDDGKTHPVIIHDVQNHFLTNRPVHVDFYEVSMTEKLKAAVTLEFTGEAKAVKELGGVLVRILNGVEVECLPADLPHSFVVDISKLATFHDSITVADLAVSSKVKILTPAEEVIAKVQPPRDMEAELATPVVEDISAVEGAAETKPEEAGAAEKTEEANK